MAVLYHAWLIHPKTGSSFLDSPLAKRAGDTPDASDLGKKPSELADAFTRGGDGDQIAQLESTLRDAVEGDVAASVGDLGAIEPPTTQDDSESRDDDEDSIRK